MLLRNSSGNPASARNRRLVAVSPVHTLTGLRACGGAQVGAAQNVFSKSSKYSLFDPCKEMAYIPLDEETQLKVRSATCAERLRLVRICLRGIACCTHNQAFRLRVRGPVLHAIVPHQSCVAAPCKEEY